MAGLLRCAHNDMASEMPLPPFHLAFPVDDLEAARRFYGSLLGCPEGRSSRAVDRLRPFRPPDRGSSGARWQVARRRPIRWMARMCRCRISESCCRWTNGGRWPNGCEAADVDFVIPPTVRFAGQPGEQATMFLSTPRAMRSSSRRWPTPAKLFAQDKLLRRAAASGACRRTRMIRRGVGVDDFEPPSGWVHHAIRPGRRMCPASRKISPPTVSTSSSFGGQPRHRPLRAIPRARAGRPPPKVRRRAWSSMPILVLVVLVLDLADDLLDDVLDGHQALGAAEFVDDDGEVDAIGCACGPATRSRPSIRARTRGRASTRRASGRARDRNWRRRHP